MTQSESCSWVAGRAPVAVVMISLNEAHNLSEILANLSGWAQEVFLVDSCSVDQTVDIALQYGVHVVQRKFRGFGDQWNFALEALPITAPWTMKIDPDERLTDSIKNEIERATENNLYTSYRARIRLHFMGQPLPSVIKLTRLWRTGSVKFSNVAANEHALCNGTEGELNGDINHLDSPNLDHWLTKQNRYTTAEALRQFHGQPLALPPNLFGTALERRMWLKINFWKIPGRYTFLFLYHLILIGAWKVGKVGWMWARLRTDVYRIWEYKYFELKKRGISGAIVPSNPGEPDSRIRFYE